MPLISLHVLRVKTKMAAGIFLISHWGKKNLSSLQKSCESRSGGAMIQFSILRENLDSRKCKYILLFVSQLNSRVSEKENFLNGNL